MPPTSFARLVLSETEKIRKLMEVTDPGDPFSVGVMTGRIEAWITIIQAAAENRVDATAAQQIKRDARVIVDRIPVPLPRVAE
jgi:hypothetical protein